MRFIGIISAINECVALFQWTKTAISSLHSRWSGSQNQSLQDRVLSQFESGLQHLQDRVLQLESGSHQHSVANLLTDLKDAVAGTKDLLDEFRWYQSKMQVEGNVSQSPFMDLFHTFIQGSITKVHGVQLRLNHVSSQLENMGPCGITQRFDKLVRTETTSWQNETKIFGRDKELRQVLRFLGVPRISEVVNSKKRKRATSSIGASTSASTSNQVSNESRILSLPILPIVGIGGVGKTTLAQLTCNHQRVKSHFELIIWICVSDDFDVKRITKEAIKACTRKEATTDNLDSLQRVLSDHMNNKRLLIVLDDMWDDALKENGHYWKRFCAPFTSVQEGSMMLVTIRCPMVNEGVRTMEPITLDIFRNFFKSCALGSEDSYNYPELEHIGRRILPKLRGSPLAARTLGCVLRMDLQASHWNFILESELWELRHEEADIFPALWSSYIYLPFYLKQCFAFCACTPKITNSRRHA